jgi:hypothetical protein
MNSTTMRIVTWLLAALLAPKLWAAGLTVSTAGGEAVAGQTFSAEVSVKGGVSVGAMQFDLAWDPAVLEFDSLEKGKLLAGGAMLESKSNSPGRLSVAWVSPDGIDADGALLRTVFKVKGQAGQSTAVSIEKLRAWGAAPGHHDGAAGQHLIDVLARGESGEFKVAAGMPRGIWIAAGAFVILVVLLTIAWRGKKRPRPRA